MATLNFTTGTPSRTTKLVGFDSVVAGSERTLSVGDVLDLGLETSTSLPASDAKAPSVNAVKAFVAAGAPVFSLGNITGAVTLNRTSGAKQNAAATGNVVLNVSNGSDFDCLELFVTASGAARTLDKHASVKITTDSALTFPVTLNSGTGASIVFKKHGAIWSIAGFQKNIPTS